MGFWKVMTNMAQGKPAFETPDNSKNQPSANQAPSPVDPAPTASVPKVVPTISITHCKSHINGSRMEVHAWVTNTSAVEIELEKVSLLSQTTQIDRRLNPEQAHEIKLYDGRIPADDSAHKANIYYQDFRANDYFCADFVIEYNFESDGVYTIEDLKPENYGVRDI